MSEERYPLEILDGESEDDGTMPENVEKLASHVVGRRIVGIERKVPMPGRYDYSCSRKAEAVLVLDNGKRVALVETDDCCAFTDLNDIVLNLDKIDHVIMGVGTTERYTKWHIYADLGDVVEMQVGWSSGNPFYYGYGFDISVIE